MRTKDNKTTVEKRRATLAKYNNKPERKAKMREYYQANKDRSRDRALQRKYGITLNEYNIMVDKQDHKCYICKRHKDEFSKTLSVDHCHKTGRVRSLLCINCNRALGMLQENVELMKKLIDYVENKC